MLYAEGVRKWENKVHNKGRAEGRAVGRAEGRAEGRAQMLFSLVDDGLLSPGVAAAKANMSEDEFRARMERDRLDRANGGHDAREE